MVDRIARNLFYGLAALILVGCAETYTATSAAKDPLEIALSGKTLVAGDASFIVGRDGSLDGVLGDGTKFVGVWSIRDGAWCNAFSEPAGFEETVCLKAVLGDGTVTIDRRNGDPVVWTIQ